MELLEVNVEVIAGGLSCEHNYPCPVYSDKPAVYTSYGYFQPSWEAQKEGWKLIRTTNRFQRFILKWFFNDRPIPAVNKENKTHD